MAVSKQERTAYEVLFDERLAVTADIMNIHKITNFLPYKFRYGERVTRYQELDIYDDKYGVIEKLFQKYCSNLCVDRVVKVYNPYLKKAFELKRQLHYKSLQPLELFHGTKDEYVDSICEYNFDWRYSGKQSPHNFGKGIHFTTDPSFASISCDDGPNKVIILAQVLVRNTCPGNDDLIVPSAGYDTATAKTANGVSYVKFNDNEFYPMYLIHCISEE